jgi:hypothetical protein
MPESCPRSPRLPAAARQTTPGSLPWYSRGTIPAGRRQSRPGLQAGRDQSARLGPLKGEAMQAGTAFDVTPKIGHLGWLGAQRVTHLCHEAPNAEWSPADLHASIRRELLDPHHRQVRIRTPAKIEEVDLRHCDPPAIAAASSLLPGYLAKSGAAAAPEPTNPDALPGSPQRSTMQGNRGSRIGTCSTSAR